jgi:hypothetical protein
MVVGPVLSGATLADKAHRQEPKKYFSINDPQEKLENDVEPICASLVARKKERPPAVGGG